MAPLLEHYGVQLWMPEAGGRVDFASEHDEHAMTVLGLSSKREVTRTSIRVRTAMAVQAREQGRYLGGRPPYGYGLGDAGPHPNRAHAGWGRRAHRLDPDPEAAHVVRWIFAQRLAGHFSSADRAGAERGGRAVPVGGGSGAEPAPHGRGVDAGHGHHDPVQPAVHRASGVEPRGGLVPTPYALDLQERRLPSVAAAGA
jgi:site-specific DNA recombinase